MTPMWPDLTSNLIGTHCIRCQLSKVKKGNISNTTCGLFFSLCQLLEWKSEIPWPENVIHLFHSLIFPLIGPAVIHFPDQKRVTDIAYKWPENPNS